MSKDALLTINAGSSTVRYAVFEASGGEVRRVGSNTVRTTDAAPAGEEIIRSLEAGPHLAHLVGVGHRVVHGGIEPLDHQRVTPTLLAALRASQPLDPVHLPIEIALIESIGQRLGGIPQVACFDSAFHRDLPVVARLLPIPHQYRDAGWRRLGFHGLSYTFLLEQLERTAPSEARGRVILAHLGGGASLAAVRDGHPVDTSMAFTPNAGLVMATRSGDLDPGLLVYLLRTERLDAAGLDDLVNRRSGLLGVSGSTGDMEELLAARQHDPRAAEAVELFCYQTRKWIGAYAAALGGLDTLVFSGGIGENAPVIREQITTGLEFLGVTLDRARNATHAPVISGPGSPVTVRVIPTDEEQVIARSVLRVLGVDPR